MPAALLVFVALLLVGWSADREGFAPAVRDPPRRYLPYLGIHIVGFAGLFAVSHALFRGSAKAPEDVGPLVGLWLLTVALTLGAWLGAMLPPRVLIARARARAGLFLGAAVLGLVALGVGRLAQGLWFPLRNVTFAAASGLLGAVTSDTFQDPDTLTFGTDAFAVEIAPACSGYEGIGLTWAFIAAALWLFRGRFRFPQALLLMVLATLLPWVANIGRLVALVLFGTHVSPELAEGGFHSYVGSILFCAVALGIVAIGLHTPWLTRESLSATAAHDRTQGLAASYLVPFMAITGAGLLSRSFSTTETEPLYALRPAAGIVALLIFRKSYGTISRRISGIAIGAGLAVAVMWFLFDMVFPQAPDAASTEPGAALLGARVATAILLAPVVEELAFRGFLARRISSSDFDQILPTQMRWSGIVVSSLAFGLLHQRAVPAVLAGLTYAMIYRRRGNLADAVVAHATTNAALVLAAWMTGTWDLWK